MSNYNIEFAEVDDIRELEPATWEKIAQASRTGVTVEWDGNTFFGPDPGQVDIAHPRMRVVGMERGHRTVRVSFKVEAFYGMDIPTDSADGDPNGEGDPKGSSGGDSEDGPESDGEAEDENEDDDKMTFTLGNPPEVDA
jgi:hypothetical protein